MVSISGSWDTGTFTAVADDTYRLSGLFNGVAPTGQAIAGYRVALGDGGGQLLLNGLDVSDRTSFTADKFGRLSYKVGADGSQQSLVVAAQTGKRLANGTLTQVTDSQTVQITANVTGTRSINAMNALSTTDLGTDANIASLVQEAGILTGIGSGRPTLNTDGNFTAVANDTYRLSFLFNGVAPTGQAIAGYRVAMGGSGQLLLDGLDVSARTTFTAAEFGRLSYKVGADGSAQSLVVAAQTGKRLANGTLTQVTDSQAVQITASVTGTRSINAMNALSTPDLGTDANITSLVKEAGILTGIGSGRPTLNTEGNFTAVANDTYRLSFLFNGVAPTGQAIAGYRVALGDGGGQLLLNGLDVSDRTSFTADEFARLSYKVGADGSDQGLVVAAQTGKRLTNGTLTQVTDSQAVQITATVGPTRSINAMNALSTTDLGADANITSLVQEAGILTGIGAGRPTLNTDGNFNAVADDTYRLSFLFSGVAPTGQAIAGYRVALGDGSGQLLLNGLDVSDRTSFTAAEFGRLSYKVGADGSQQSLVVAAQTGKRLTNGTLTQVTDSQAVQITATVGFTRSINAMNALSTTALGTDDNITSLVKEAGILTGIGSGRPTLQTSITPDPSAPLSTLATSAGAYNSAGGSSSATMIDPLIFNSATTGGALTADVFIDPTSWLVSALLLLGGQAAGAFRVAGNGNGLSQAISAYTTAKVL